MSLFVKLFLFFAASLTTLSGVELVLDAADHNDTLPMNFRSCLDPFPIGTSASRVGFDTLRASGSAQFSKKGLQAIRKKLATQNVTIVDLRQESHGHVDDIAISWHTKDNAINKGLLLPDIEKEERDLLHIALKKKELHIKVNAQGHLKKITVTKSINEATLVKRHGLHYLRLPILDNCGPTADDLNRFVDSVKMMPIKNWLHFHCRRGIGRTTTFLVLYDIFRNAKEVSLADITARHALTNGGFDLLTTLPIEGEPYYDCQQERRAIVQQFYDYCRANTDGFHTPFVYMTK